MEVSRGKRRMFWLSLIIFGGIMLGGCLPEQDEPTEIVEIEDDPANITSAMEVEENYYRGLVPFEPSEARGRLYNHLSAHRLDADRMEVGMLEIAQEYFPPEDHLFQDGQYIHGGDLTEWLAVESDDHPHGLNPADAPGEVLVHILEHNYLDTEGEGLEGMVIGLALASTYEISTDEEQGEEEGGQPQTERRYFTPDEARNYGQQIAADIAAQMRNRMQEQDVPLIFALYQLEAEGEMSPGNFLSTGLAEGGSSEVSDWETMNEVFHIFPSADVSELNPELAADFADLQENTQDFFPNSVGVVGTGRFIDEQLVELTLDVSTEFASRTEVIQLTQYVGSQAMETFSENIHMNIYVQSIQEPRAVLIRPSDGETMMHVYR